MRRIAGYGEYLREGSHKRYYKKGSMKDFTTNRLIQIDGLLTKTRKAYQVAREQGDAAEMNRLEERGRQLNNEQKMLEGVIERRKHEA